MQKNLEYIIKFLIGTTFFVPLILLPSSYIFPFIVPKIVWFRSLVLLMLAIYILLLSCDWNKYKIRLTPINIAVGLFFISFAVSTFVGVDWYRSFWDNHERMLGLFTIFHYVVYYFIIVSTIKGWEDWKWILRTFLFAGGIVMFIGLLQKANPELLLNRGDDRVSATLGNSIYFSGYGLFLLSIGYLLAIKENVKKANPWFWYAALGGALGLWGIFGGGARGAFLGLVVGLCVLITLYVFTLKKNKKLKQGLIALMILGIVVLGLLFNFRQTNFVKNIPAVGRLVNTELSSTNTRVMAWSIAIDAWKEKPVFGWGPNNYYYAYNKYYRPEFLEHGWGETWFDNAHSVVMNTIAVQGGVGIIAYLGMFVVAVVMLWRGYKRNNLDKHIFGVGFAFLLAHLASLVTVFDNPTSYLYFFFFLAFVSQYAENPDLATVKNTNKNVSLGLAIVVGCIVLLLIYSTNINPAKANGATLEAIQGFSNGRDVPQLYLTASNIPTPHIDDVRNDFARSVSGSLPSYLQHNQIEKADKLFNLALDELKKNQILHPLDIRINIQMAQLIQTRFQSKPADVRPEFLFLVESVLQDALEKSPKRQQVFYTLSTVKMQLGKFAEAEKILRQTIDDNPKIAEGWWRLALVYQQSGNYGEALKIIDEALSSSEIILDSRSEGIMHNIINQISNSIKPTN
jgi:O-antigen ligase